MDVTGVVEGERRAVRRHPRPALRACLRPPTSDPRPPIRETSYA